LLREQWPGSLVNTKLPGQVMAGSWLSRTMTRCWQVAVLPHEAVAVQVTKLVPRENTAGALLVSTTPPQPANVTVGGTRPVFVATQTPVFAKFVTSAGQVMVGGGLVTTM
jgi:hypothetical protein